MAYSYDFKDNIVYGAEDINAIRASILTKGVIEEESTSLKVISENNGIKILEGQAIFSDGCKIAVDSDGVIKDIVQGTLNYVYLLNNTLAGVCEIIASTEMPTGDYVLLATVSAEGEISDEREFAQLKTADSERYAASFEEQFTMTDNTAENTVVATINLPKSNCSYIEMTVKYGSFCINKVKLFPKEDGFVIWNYENYNTQTGYVHEFACSGLYGNVCLKYEVSGNQMVVRCMGTSISNPTSNLRSVKITGVCMR